MYLGIDCGTQSLKVLAWDPINGTSDSASESYDLIGNLPPGYKEQHPYNWIDALEGCMGALRQQGVDLSAVRGIGVSGQQHGLVVLDSSHRVIRPAKLWNDTSTEAHCSSILEAAGGISSYIDEIGNALPPGFTASKIAWIKEHEPDSYLRIRSLMLPHDYLNFYLTGEMTAESGDASGTGYFRVRQRAWSTQALSWIDPDRDLQACLPRLIQSDEPAGVLRVPLAQKWGMRSAVAISSGGGDNMMGAIGSGNVSPGTLTVSLGTSGTLYSCSSSPVIDPRGEVAAFCSSSGEWLPLVCTMNVTVATEMIRTGFFGAGLADFDRQIEQVPAGSEGLLLLPYLEGERVPNSPKGTGVLLGIRPATASPPYLARAAMEGVTLGLKYGLERLKELGLAPNEIRLIGGGSRSRVWRGIAADVLGVTCVSPRNEEGPAFGAALQAAWCDQGGEITTLVKECVELDEATRQVPDQRLRSLYEELYEVYAKLSETLVESDVFPSHRRFIE